MRNIPFFCGAIFLFCLGFIAAIVNGMAAESDDEKIEKLRQMFAGQYQEEDYYRTDRLLLSATGSLKPVHLAPSVASVITKDDIEKIGATTLDEILETVPGLHVLPNGFNYHSPIWSIRGVQLGLNPHVLMLINGVPFKSIRNGDRSQTFWMPVQQIRRVEVIRGPGSAMHGAEAFTGVVNVITKDGQEINGTTVGIRAGSFDTYDGFLEHGGVYKGWDIAFAIEGLKTGGDPDRKIDQDRLGTGAPSLTPTWLDSWHDLLDVKLGLRKGSWSLHLFGSLQDDPAGAGPIQVITHENDMDTKYFMGDFTYERNKLIDDLDFSLRVHYLYLENDTFVQIMPASFRNMLGNPISKNKISGVESTVTYAGFFKHMFRFNFGGKYSATNPSQYKNWGPGVAEQYGSMVDITGTEYVYMTPHNRNLWYFALQDEWVFAKRWELTAGVRYDEYSDFGETVNPRAALVWEARYDLTAKLLYGQAFRAPSFSELYIQNNVMATGSLDLGPEKMESLELVFDYQPTADLRVICNLFVYQADDLIEFVPPVPQTAQNYSKQEGRGLELEMDWILDTFRVRSNFAYQRSENKKKYTVVPDAPEMQFYLNPHWDFGDDWSLDGQYFWIDNRHRAQGDPRDDIDDYQIVNLTLRRKNIANRWDVALSLRNLFEDNVREPSPFDASAPFGAYIPNDYPMAGRSIWGEVRCRF